MKASLLHAAVLAFGCIVPATASGYFYEDPFNSFPLYYVNYAATFFSGPNCTGDIGTGPIVNFGCSDHCFPANGALSVMLEGKYYDAFAESGGDKEESNYNKEKFKFKYNYIDKDGPVAYPISTGECNDTYEMGRIAIRRGHKMICASFDRPAYSFLLHFLRMCTPDDRLDKVGRPIGPSKMTSVKDWSKVQQGEGFVAWTGSDPAADDEDAGAGADGSEEQHAEGPLPDDMEDKGSGEGKVEGKVEGLRLEKGWQGDWAKNAKGWQDPWNGIPEDAPFDWYGRPKTDKFKPKPKYKPVPEREDDDEDRGVIWGDTARDQVGYWDERLWPAPKEDRE
ncbi:hypothetical protein TOPH_05162 [Tolypocladium ophioglossoides CBS 100239]|uniref:Uncharacterized protein n=1 Tax=Tolypocladium ophioglossoides (strain CBS 100239) TaxID=1163406 RepID=A0A0L0N894_TOLOC|nr:hypothetical protein TOPH_05162 [Tolypocladium ophioglossoides CBS 100239]